MEKNNIRLGVNIDHIATIRTNRNTDYPSLIDAVNIAEQNGADLITIHLREDRRHIKDNDAKKICLLKDLKINLEISTNPKIIKIALRIKPNFICIVPENRQEITTEGGLDLKKNKNKIKKILSQFKRKNIRTSLFINPSLEDIKIANKLGADCVEIHTGRFSNLVKSKSRYSRELIKISKCSKLAKKLKIEVHAGHGLDYKSTKLLSRIEEIEEFNIGHFLIGESIFNGLTKVIKNFKKIIR